VSELADVRKNTLKLLREADESWLLEDRYWENGLAYNHYWMWFHVMEDEISHRGQIKFLKRFGDGK
jgi:uncharacterized damage-inducible protein DinB